MSKGFTLIEMVISAAIMSIILTGAYLCLSSGLRSQKVVEARADMVQSARVAMSLICADLRAARPLSKEFDFLGMQRTLGEAEGDNVDFGTCNYTPRRPREGDFCEVSYYVAEENPSGALTLWRRRDPTPDDEPLSGGSREEIARGVREFRLEYYDGFDWYDTWGDPTGKRKKSDSFKVQPNLSGLPEAVRITLSIGSTKPKESEEPPLTFQTVCRLNLAGITEDALSSASTGSGKGTPKDQSPAEGATQ
ncbi:MAG TPA: prepilin-type N-terminal cleavage/methylation domain-containing protein [Candidatus Saccharimonadales bacterium]|nr:prepilin-type N-terminal cleavage/methylation domain-containing protein [Candidatus Saccharimonadales bacterium]